MNLLALSTWLLITTLSSLAVALDVPTALTNYLSSYGFPINLEIFSDTPGNASTVQWLSEPNTLDAPHVFPINDTTYQWWWYDVISPNAESSIVLIFFTATSDGFALLPSTAGAVSLSIQALLPNGTTVLASIPASAAVVASGGLLGNGTVVSEPRSGYEANLCEQASLVPGSVRAPLSQALLIIANTSSPLTPQESMGYRSKLTALLRSRA